MNEMDNVSRKILEDARAVRRENIKKAEEKASQILAEAKKKVKKIIDDANQQAKQHYKVTYDMEYTKEKTALDQKILLAKLELVEKIINRAKERLAKLDRQGWKKFLKKMSGKLNIAGGTYIIGKKEKVVDQSLMSIINNVKPGSRDPDFDKGVKIMSGKAEIILLPENYLDMDIEDLKMEVATYLFGGEKR